MGSSSVLTHCNFSLNWNFLCFSFRLQFTPSSVSFWVNGEPYSVYNVTRRVHSSENG